MARAVRDTPVPAKWVLLQSQKPGRRADHVEPRRPDDNMENIIADKCRDRGKVHRATILGIAQNENELLYAIAGHT
jgi:hypothetical protein